MRSPELHLFKIVVFVGVLDLYAVCTSVTATSAKNLSNVVCLSP